MIPGTVHVPCIQYPGLNLWRGPVAIGSFSGGVWGFAHLLQPVSVWIVPRPSGCKLASRPTALLSGARPWQPQFSTFQKQRIGTRRRLNRYKPCPSGPESDARSSQTPRQRPVLSEPSQPGNNSISLGGAFPERRKMRFCLFEQSGTNREHFGINHPPKSLP